MYPILLSIGPISIYTAHVFAIVAWLVFSFVFWKKLRANGVLEERIFDLTFYATIVGVMFARLGFVVLYPQLFLSSLLLIGAFWVQPGLWLYAGLLGVFGVFYVFSKRFHLQFSQVLDASAYAIPWTMIPISLGTFFAGHEIGKITTLSLSVVYPGIDGRRHPVQFYEIFCLIFIGVLSQLLYHKSQEHKWPQGLSGSIIIAFLSSSLFLLEFLKDSSLLLYHVSINQWVLIFLFAQSIGSIIIKLQRMGILFPKKGVSNHESPAPESK